ncbi:nickel pincer cofactor biosynthesis protein LarB [Lagierella sp.]|uniref:nickel pincer cofactor biosynthesis protein LarB n=1 Tax=Lagierella sp. TaxID=2849657 RepID=UPI002636F9AD|nr:nickel pincer cofactor biosynthesis protein LarB [Lagierella sp.]
MNTEIKKLLQGVQNGTVSVDEAMLSLKSKPFEDIDFAKVDLHRQVRQGATEVIYGGGKTAEQIVKILSTMVNNGQRRILITRLSKEGYKEVCKFQDLKYYESAKIGILGDFKEPDGIGEIVIATGGTSDIPVAEEAYLTARMLGNRVNRLYDVGVSGVHRLLAKREVIMKASVIVAVAGMEGALASVIGGLADCPVIAVPTSVGYGASFNGVAALLSMLNSCASGVSVVNIDNGFGAGYLASMINHMEVK